MVNTDNTLAETTLTPRQRLQDNIKMNFKERGRSLGWFRLDRKNIDCRIFFKNGIDHLAFIKDWQAVHKLSDT